MSPRPILRPPILLSLALGLSWGTIWGASPQEGAAPRPVNEAVSYPPAYEIGPRALRLANEAAALREELSSLTNLDPLAEPVARVRERHQRLSAELEEELVVEGAVAIDRVRSLRAAVGHQSQLLGQLIERLFQRLQRLDEIRQDWEERRRFWRGWRAHLRGTSELETYQEELDRSLERIGGVLEEVAAGFARLQALQQELEGLQREALASLDRLNEALATWRQGRLRRSAPSLASRAYLASLDRRLLAEAWRGVVSGWRLPPGFLAERGWVLFLQVLLALGVGLAARRLRPYVREDEPWQRILARPWAIGVFLAVATLSFLYRPLPASWRLILWVFLGASGCRLAAGMFRNPRKRLLFYLLVVAYLVLLAFEAVALPHPLRRLILALLALLASPFLLALASRNARASPDTGQGFTFALRLGALVALGIFLAQFLGFARLAHWLAEVALATALVGFLVVVLIRLGQGGIHLLLHHEFARQWGVLRRLGPGLSVHLSRFLQIALILGAFLFILDVWGIYESPGEAWRLLVEKSLGAGPIRITVGQILLVGLALYLAVVISWLVRALLEEELIERRNLDRGVGESVKTLSHYFILVAGFFVALSLAGFELRNFAIVAGALGVGVGFGLQNVVNNFVSGLILLFERPIRPGDLVVVEERWGTVEKIGLRSTVILTFDQAEVIVPNSDLISKQVTNWTLSNRVARVLIEVGVAYGSDLEKVFRILHEVATGHPEVLAEPAPFAVFTGFGDSSLNFELRVWVADISRRLVIQSDLLREIDDRFRAAGIEIPFPQRDLHLRSVEPELVTGLERGREGKPDSSPNFREGVPPEEPSRPDESGGRS